MLDKVIAFGAERFVGKFDKGGKPYVLHCFEVMRKVSRYTDDEEVLAAAFLHDAVEDEVATRAEVFALTSARVLGLVVRLSKEKGTTYDSYINGILECRDAAIIKMCDIEHNSDIHRLKGISDKDFRRMQKYHTAFLKLKAVVEGQ